MKDKLNREFLSWGAKAILTTIIFPGFLMAVGWFLSFVTTATKTQAEIEGMKELNRTQYSNIHNSLIDIKEDQKSQKQDIAEIRKFLMTRGY